MGDSITAELCTLMAVAASLYVRGKKWDEVGEAIDREGETVRRWQYRYPAEWNAAVVKAIDESLGEYELEALQVCRLALRRQDTGDALRAANMLLTHTRDLRGTVQKIQLTGSNGGPVQHVDIGRLAADPEAVELLERLNTKLYGGGDTDSDAGEPGNVPE